MDKERKELKDIEVRIKLVKSSKEVYKQVMDEENEDSDTYKDSEENYYKLEKLINELENEYQSKKDEYLSKKKETLRDKISQKMKLYISASEYEKMEKEIETMESRKDTYERVAERAKKDLEKAKEKRVNGDKRADDKTYSARLEVHEKLAKDLEKIIKDKNEELSKYIVIEENQEEYNSLKDLEEQIEKATFEDIDTLEEATNNIIDENKSTIDKDRFTKKEQQDDKIPINEEKIEKRDIVSEENDLYNDNGTIIEEDDSIKEISELTLDDNIPYDINSKVENSDDKSINKENDDEKKTPIIQDKDENTVEENEEIDDKEKAARKYIEELLEEEKRKTEKSIEELENETNKLLDKEFTDEKDRTDWINLEREKEASIHFYLLDSKEQKELKGRSNEKIAKVYEKKFKDEMQKIRDEFFNKRDECLGRINEKVKDNAAKKYIDELIEEENRKKEEAIARINEYKNKLLDEKHIGQKGEDELLDFIEQGKLKPSSRLNDPEYQKLKNISDAKIAEKYKDIYVKEMNAIRHEITMLADKCTNRIKENDKNVDENEQEDDTDIIQNDDDELDVEAGQYIKELLENGRISVEKSIKNINDYTNKLLEEKEYTINDCKKELNDFLKKIILPNSKLNPNEYELLYDISNKEISNKYYNIYKKEMKKILDKYNYEVGECYSKIEENYKDNTDVILDENDDNENDEDDKKDKNKNWKFEKDIDEDLDDEEKVASQYMDELLEDVRRYAEKNKEEIENYTNDILNEKEYIDEKFAINMLRDLIEYKLRWPIPGNIMDKLMDECHISDKGIALKYDEIYVDKCKEIKANNYGCYDKIRESYKNNTESLKKEKSVSDIKKDERKIENLGIDTETDFESDKKIEDMDEEEKKVYCFCKIEYKRFKRELLYLFEKVFLTVNKEIDKKGYLNQSDLDYCNRIIATDYATRMLKGGNLNKLYLNMEEEILSGVFGTKGLTNENTKKYSKLLLDGEINKVNEYTDLFSKWIVENGYYKKDEKVEEAEDEYLDNRNATPKGQQSQDGTINQMQPPAAQQAQNGTGNQVQPGQAGTINQMQPPTAQPVQNSTVYQAPQQSAQPVQNSAVYQAPQQSTQPRQNSVINPQQQYVQQAQRQLVNNIKKTDYFYVSLNEQGLVYKYMKGGMAIDEKSWEIIKGVDKILKTEWNDCLLRDFVSYSISGYEKIKNNKKMYDELMKDIAVYDMAGAEKYGFKARRQLRKLVKRFEKAGIQVRNKECVKFSFKNDILKGLSSLFKGSKKRIAGKTQKQALLDQSKQHNLPSGQDKKTSNDVRKSNFVREKYSTKLPEDIKGLMEEAHNPKIVQKQHTNNNDDLEK